jgi:hemerythrin-like domain-containing protein
MKSTATRRAILLAAATGVALVSPWAARANQDDSLRNEDRGPGEQKAVGSVEDLMRGHGVLRRILLVYEQSADKLRDGHSVNLAALNDAARLFRTFGEDHHEKTLEEAFVFPTLRKIRGPASAYPDILTAQHHRGREVTDYILETTERRKLSSGRATALARAFDSFARMYQNHAAREDTLVFPVWKQALAAPELDDLGYQFEEIDQQQFGKEGFDITLEQIAAIENALGYADLAQFTAPIPPRVA